ncbi:MAG: hypothetical protein AAF330_05190 [Pseudomonadota bacterium]
MTQKARPATEKTASVSDSAATKPETTTTPAPAQPQAPAAAQPQASATAAPKATQKGASTLFEKALAFVAPGADAERIGGLRDIWETLNCDELPAELAMAVFDCAVDQGPKAAERLLGKVDGLALAGQEVEPEMLLDDLASFLAWRLRRYAFTANAASNMQAWSRHIMRLHAFILTELHTPDAA